MVEISLSGSGEGSGRETGRSYSTVSAGKVPRLPTGSVGWESPPSSHREVSMMGLGSAALQQGRRPLPDAADRSFGGSATLQQGRRPLLDAADRGLGVRRALEQGRRPLPDAAERGLGGRPRPSRAVGHTQARPTGVWGCAHQRSDSLRPDKPAQFLPEIDSYSIFVVV